VISNENFTKTLNALKDSIVEKAGSTFKNINVNFDATEALKTGQGILQQIIDFFRGLIDGLMGG